jgi:uncharacterized protein DUF3667
MDFQTCLNCGASLSGRFCSQCGEEKIDRNHLKLSSFAHRAFEDFTDLEHSKFFGTLSSLVRRPGFLTQEYLGGRKKAYIGPLKLYLTIFALSLFLYSIYRPVAVYDMRTITASDARGNWTWLMQHAAASKGMAYDVFVDEVSARWQRYISFSQIIYPLVVAGLLKILFWKKRRYYVEHLIFALHFLALLYLSTIALWPLYALVGVKFTPGYFAVTVLAVAWPMVYGIIAVRRVYEQSWLIASLKGLLLYFGYFLATTVITLAALSIAIMATSPH